MSTSQRNAQRPGNTLAVGGIGLVAVAGVAFFYESGAAGHCTGGVFKEELLLFRGHKAEEVSRL